MPDEPDLAIGKFPSSEHQVLPNECPLNIMNSQDKRSVKERQYPFTERLRRDVSSAGVIYGTSHGVEL